MNDYYIVYLLDASKNFFITAKEDDLLDFIMRLKYDGDLAHYGIYERIFENDTDTQKIA